jgi:hypothetical protein
MNVTFHALGSFAVAAVLSLKAAESEFFGLKNSSTWLKMAIGFVAGILIHGILDFLPHQYPLRSKFDVIFALGLLALTVFLAQKQNRLLILVCFGGAIFSDIIDLSAEIVNKYLGISIPHLPFKIFPWHWKEYSGSIYDGSQAVESNIYHILVLLICLGLLHAYRKRFFRFWKIKSEVC